jgi:hypothetical protein
MSHGNAPLRGNAALTFWPGPRPCGGDPNPRPVRETHLERARRIAFYLSQRHRRGTPEFRYWLRLECDIACEMLRREESTGATETEAC